MKIARDRNRDGRYTHVLAHECVLCEDHETVLVYLNFGAPGDDPSEADVSDIAGIDHPIREQDFNAREAARSFEGVVASINSGVGLPHLLSFLLAAL